MPPSIVADNVFTYIHRLLDPGGLGNERGYLALSIDNTTKVLTLLLYNDADDWVAQGGGSTTIIGTELAAGTVYHLKGRNPIVLDSDILRLLPGQTSKPDSTNEAKPLWIGYIDRDFFDGIYVTPTDYTAGFRAIPATIDPPNLTITLDGRGSGTLETGHYWWKFTYLYDGIQESLFSDPVDMLFATDNRLVQFNFSITQASHNKRVTAMNMYRSAAFDGPYTLVHTLDFLRPTGEVLSGSAGYSGLYALYIPALSTFNFVGATSYEIQIGTDTAKWDIESVNGTGHDVFILKSGQGPIVGTQWDEDWELFIVSGASQDSGTSGGYAGEGVVVLETDIGDGNYGGGLLYFDILTVAPRTISVNAGKAVNYTGTDTGMGSPYTAESWQVLRVDKGLYAVAEDGADVDYKLVDPGLTAGAEHALAGEVSIKVNGAYARMIGGRLWQAKIILDPGGTAEQHDDWVSYSELDQPDVNPVSNMLTIPDREGGVCTGLADVFGNPVILKEQSITVIDTKTYPDDPTKWRSIESAHNIGNLAAQGSISVLGNLYTCWHDAIYRLRPNNLAETDQTPTERLAITEPIKDVYQALTLGEKQAIQSIYEHRNGEIIFRFVTAMYAYNITTGHWRTITQVLCTLMTLDENADVMIYTSFDGKLYYPGVSASVAADMKTKKFVLSLDQTAPVHRVLVTYKSSAALSLKVYLDSVTSTYTLASTSGAVSRAIIGVNQHARTVTVEVLEPSADTNNTEIHRIQVEAD